MKLTGISTRIVVRVEVEPGEWILPPDNDLSVVRIESAWYGTAGWAPQAWAVGRRKDGTWSKSERNCYTVRDIPTPVHQALDSALRLVAETALGLDTAAEWAALNLREFWVR
jgi:hypothetical protein